MLTRRNCLRFVGMSVASLPVVGAGASKAAAAEYRTVTVPAGESRQFAVGDGETLENLLIDVSADGADAQIVADGAGWTIRNVGFRGTTDRGWNTGFPGLVKCSGHGVIEHCYMGDGVVSGIEKGAIGPPSGHSGHIEIRNCHVAGWTVPPPRFLTAVCAE